MAAPLIPAIDYGARLRAGILVPSGNSVAEPELHAMQANGTSLLVTRLSLRGSSKAELMRMLDQLEGASTLLNSTLWWVTVQTILRIACGLSLWGGYAIQDVLKRLLGVE